MGAAVLRLFLMNKEELVGDVLIDGSLDYSYCETVLFKILKEMSEKSSRITTTNFWSRFQFV